jgi:class 3 adenylate cyclase
MASHTERLILAVAQVAGSTKACARHGDAAMFDTLQGYYVLASEAARMAGGRVIKPIGDAVLLTFPLDRAKDAVHALQYLQARGTALWARLDEQCCVQVKVGAGPVQCGPLGAPGDERYDVVGEALNSLFKAPSSDFYVSPEATPFLT